METITPPKTKKLHFHSLDALRFFAFLKVYLLHLPVEGDFPIFKFLKSGGGIGVSFFFVLSGFLITYLLVFEKQQKGKINIKNFFIRRSLRIWPLFYITVLVVFLLPYDFKQLIGFHMVGGGYDLDWKYSFTFIENYKALMMDASPKTTPLSVFWSLCIEEHFYILWLIMMPLIPLKHIFKFLISCFFIAWTSRYIEPFIFGNFHISSSDLFTNIDLFAGGGILGYFIAIKHEKTLLFINKISLPLKYTILSAITLIILFQDTVLPNESGTIFYIFRPSVIAILFTILLCLFIPPNSKIRIKSKTLSYLGERSFGLYIFHIIFIHSTLQLCFFLDIKLDNMLNVSCFALITFGCSVLLSALSYKYFESIFMNLREKLTR